MKLTCFTLLLFTMSHVNAEIVVFIGAPISVARSQQSCMKYIEQPDKASGLEAICMDRVFNLKYEIQEKLYGQFNTDLIEFIGFYHYSGMPGYTSFEPAFVIVEKKDDFYRLVRIDSTEKEMRVGGFARSGLKMKWKNVQKGVMQTILLMTTCKTPNQSSQRTPERPHFLFGASAASAGLNR